MAYLQNKIRDAVAFLHDRLAASNPLIGVVLGSGLGGFADVLEDRSEVSTSEIPHWPVSTVEGHRGCLVSGKIQGKSVLVLQGRVHYYEGYSIQEVVFPVRIVAALGLKSLILTNAAGGINPEFRPGDLMVITDHINLMGVNPLAGYYDTNLGPRFPDMSAPYDVEYIAIAESEGIRLGLSMRKGLLVATMGPSYETRAEVSMIRMLGGDAVCMSVIPEVIASVQMGIRVLGVSCITNMATGLSMDRLAHEEVKEAAENMEKKFIELIKNVIIRI